jgi:cyclohexyl-isocyanide hydratase
VAQLVSAQGTYVSQPERAPLYKQPDSSAAMLAGAALDILWVPGGDPDALARIMSDPASPYLAYLCKVEKHAKWVCSVCEGALLLARAGLLDGHRATTHWAFVDCLRRFQAIKVARGHPRFVESGNRLTGGGISSGLDEALHLIARLFDDKTAADVQTTTQYFPVPPVACKVPSRTPTCMVHW